jgi:methyl-accepting chemotaxis protein
MQDSMKVRTKIHLAIALVALGTAALGGIGLWSAGKPSATDARWLLWIVMALTLLAAFGAASQLVRSVAVPLETLAHEANLLRQAAARGDLDTRADASKHQGEFREIVDATNAALGAAADKLAWQVAIIDAVPFPIHVTDADMKWTFMNKPFEALMVREGRVKDRKQAVGMACSNATANICNTEGCGIRQFNQGVKESFFDWCGMGCKQDTNAVLNKKGEKIGYVEIVSDLTALIRVKDYTKVEVERLSSNLALLAAGDMDLDLQVATGDQHTTEARANFTKLKDQLDSTARALNDLLAKVADAAEQVSSASGQIASSSQAVASGASQQARSLEDTTSRLESMATMTKLSTDNAQQANTLAQTAKGATEAGTVAVEQMVGAMAKIRTSAESTSQIIKDINEITFQTNLLALNAAVEAARAGEAGRGFAVVAEEVRSLALRSKEAAQKTEELIRQSVKETEAGAATSKQVNDRLAEIAKGIGKVTEIVAEIASTAREQASGIEHVNTAMTEMNKVTQQNAANSEESSSAAEELSGQAQELSAMVSTFKIKREGYGATAGAQPQKRNGSLTVLPPGRGGRGARATPRLS